MSARIVVSGINAALGMPRLVRIERCTPDIDNDAVESIWQRLCAENPRLHDGPILAFDGYDQASNEVRVYESTYRLHATAAEAGTGVLALGVTAVLGAGGKLVIGRRAHDTRIYGGQWELGPSGGVAIGSDLWKALAQEVREEAGLDLFAASPIALVEDRIASSVDIVAGVRTRGGEPTAASWEYDEVVWASLTELGAMADSGTLSPPTAALVRSIIPGESGGIRLV